MRLDKNNAADAQCNQHVLKRFKSGESSLPLININLGAQPPVWAEILKINMDHYADAQRAQHDLNHFKSC